MTIKQIFAGQGFGVIDVKDNAKVLHLTHDSRDVRFGSLFFAIRGGKTDGKMFIMNAISKGAVAVVTDEVIEGFPQIIVRDVRQSMALASKKFYKDACDKLKIIGITGTNGKTTTAHITEHILKSSKIKTGLIGTLSNNLTTPDPIELHEIFYNFYKSGVKVVVMECSAHAIHLKKLAGITFDVGVFTNLSVDHLDFFKDYREYADTKLGWFDKSIKTAIVNSDDKESERIDHDNIINFSINDEVKFKSPLLGKFNRYNILASINTCRALKVSMRKIRRALKTLKPVPGRFNTINICNVTAVVDYAHTPDGLENVISACKEICKGRLITVFGCGGERDVGKRSVMGSIAGKLCDFTVVTSDNPRGESPMSIMVQIEAGVKLYTKNYKLIQDRAKAIDFAMNLAKDGDVVLVAGKGAEDHIEIGGKKIPFSDYEYLAGFDKN